MSSRQGMSLLSRNRWKIFILFAFVASTSLYLVKYNPHFISSISQRGGSRCPFYSREKSLETGSVGKHGSSVGKHGGSVGKHGGWKYDQDLIKRQHVAFDDGFARRIVEHVTKNTQNKGATGYSPVTVGDIGAGVGQFGAWLSDNAVTNVSWSGWDGGTNVESLVGMDVQLVGVSHYVVPSICYIDAAVDLKPFMDRMEDAPYDWVVSVEVGEHIPQQKAEVFMDNLVALARVGVILTWAVPGQGGFMHVNEQDNEYVIEAMKDRGMVYNRDESVEMRKAVKHLPWLKKTILVFEK